MSEGVTLPSAAVDGNKIRRGGYSGGGRVAKKMRKKFGKDCNFGKSSLSEDAGLVSFSWPGAASTNGSLVRRAKIRKRSSSLTLLRRKTVGSESKAASHLQSGWLYFHTEVESIRRARQTVAEERNKKKSRSNSQEQVGKLSQQRDVFLKVRHPLSYAAIEARRSFAVATSHKTTSKTTAERPHACAGSASCESNVAAAAASAAAYDCSINKSTQQRCCR